MFDQVQAMCRLEEYKYMVRKSDKPITVHLCNLEPVASKGTGSRLLVLLGSLLIEVGWRLRTRYATCVD
jgi:hypothetical protein